MIKEKPRKRKAKRGKVGEELDRLELRMCREAFKRNRKRRMDYIS